MKNHVKQTSKLDEMPPIPIGLFDLDGGWHPNENLHMTTEQQRQHNIRHGFLNPHEHGDPLTMERIEEIIINCLRLSYVPYRSAKSIASENGFSTNDANETLKNLLAEGTIVEAKIRNKEGRPIFCLPHRRQKWKEWSAVIKTMLNG